MNQRSAQSPSDATPPALASHPGRCFVEVAPFAPVRGLFTYEVDSSLGERRPVRGARVLVPFGRRTVAGVIVACGSKQELAARGQIRSVSELLDAEPCLPEDLLDLLCWAADYYFAAAGELIRAALPPVLHGRERRFLTLTEEGREVLAAHEALLRREDLTASPEEVLLLETLSRRGGSAPRGAAGERGSGSTLVRRLLARGWVSERTSRKNPAAPRTDLRVSVNSAATTDVLKRAPRQAELLVALTRTRQPVLLGSLSGLPKDARALLRKLEDKGLVTSESVEVPRDPFASEPIPADVVHQLTPEQDVAVERLVAAARSGQFSGFLLHGVTGSGKTEVYLRLIAEVLAGGRGALVLVPEIALTPQLAARFRARFGENVAVMHSALSEGDRYEQWCRIRAGAVQIVVGARSAVFSPLGPVGVVIVDEEHDPSFKQEDGVRYQARDLALLRAQRAGAVAVLGSATPSLESHWGVTTGRLELLEMRERATSNPLPSVEIIDLRRHRLGPDGLLSAPLRVALEQTLAHRRQAILFLNRRGFSTFVLCKGCGYVFRCVNCSVSLTHHHKRSRLVCHYCGYHCPLPACCPECKSERVEMLGFGTQKVEEALKQLFPQARIGRLDRDTAGSGGLRRVLGQMQRGELDILVGTQMVTKGHDFPQVTLVGVLCADLGLQFPDFRASERTFQLLTQVAGRAGRGDDAGRVVVQTYSPEHPAVEAARRHDFAHFSAAEIATRTETQYPPFSHVAAIHVDGEREELVARVAGELARQSRRLPEIGSEVALLGPAEAPIQRLKGRTRWMLLLKSATRRPLRRVVGHVLSIAGSVGSGVRVSVDIDPVQML